MAPIVSPVEFAPGVSAIGVNPGFWSRFLSAAKEYHEATGKRVRVNSAYRSTAQQAALRAANPTLAAAPGRSMHEYGYALDIPGDTATDMVSRGLLEKYGLWRPLMRAHITNKEPWHIEPRGIVYDKVRNLAAGTLGAVVLAAAIWYLVK